MVGQLGSTFKDSEGGVSDWIKFTSTKQLAFFAAWTYWVVQIPYLAQKPQTILIAVSYTHLDVYKRQGCWASGYWDLHRRSKSFLSILSRKKDSLLR